MRRSEPGARSIKSLSYVSLVAPMIEGMQEQQAEIDQLQTGLTAVLKNHRQGTAGRNQRTLGRNRGCSQRRHFRGLPPLAHRQSVIRRIVEISPLRSKADHARRIQNRVPRPDFRDTSSADENMINWHAILFVGAVGKQPYIREMQL
jgi:hypothetical protein